MMLPRLACSLLLALATAAWADPPTARLLELSDDPVFDASGGKIADVYDVVVDTEEARASFLVISVGMRLVPIPLPSPELKLEAGRASLAMDRARVQAIPTLDMTELGTRYQRGRDILGGPLKEATGAEIGKVRDLVIGLSDGKVANVVVEFDPKIWDKPGWVALPRQSVRAEGRGYVAAFNLDDMRPASQARAEQRRAEAARAAAANIDRDERASELLGRKLVGDKGQALGEVSDLALELASGAITHLLVSTATGGRATLALPAQGLKRDGERLVLPAGAGALLPALPPKEQRLASELMRHKLANQEGKDVGRMRDIVVNLARAKVHYAVAEFDPNWVAAGNLVTVRMPKDDEMKVELNALMGAMMFAQGSWPDLNNPQFIASIDQYLARK